MLFTSRIALSLAMPSLALGVALPVAAQTPAGVQTMPRPTPDADALAGAMRRLGANPRDLNALITAAELSLKLGDVTAAAALLKRADQIDPMNGRVKAGMARILVSQERPGEALRYFDQATGYGLDPRSFAGDRGLAYDLIGEQERAQRDYRLALRDGAAEDEIQRRYALSLGISGRRDEALAQIDALLRRSDRGAWRAHAFILAMTGDVPEAEKIAARMMPPGMAAGLRPFLARLPSLPAADRAFAVHFGEVRATPQRIADRQLAPPLPALAPEQPASRPVQVAAAPTNAPAAATPRDRRRERAEARERERAERASRTQLAAVTSRRRERAGSLPQAPRYNTRGGVTFAAPREVAQALPRSAARSTRAAAAPPAAQSTPAQPTSAPAQVAAAPVAPAAAAGTASSTPAATPAPARLAAATPSTRPAAPTPGFSSLAAPAEASRPPATPAPVATAAALPAPAAPAATGTATPAATSLAAASPTSPAAPAAVGGAAPLPAVGEPVRLAASTAAPPAVAAPAPAPASAVARAAPLPAPPPLAGDSILARIMAGITIPAEELGVAPIRPAPAPAAAAPAPAAAAPVAVAAATPPPAKAPPAAKPAEPAPDPKEVARKAAAERKAAEAKKLADAKAAEARKLADAKKAAERKKAEEEAREARSHPSRIWVQVAGGARVADLPKAWAQVQAKAEALKGRTGYTTPLRATNRVVTGPFKTDAEARAFVNTLAKQGVPAFPFTSEKGQKLTKLDAK